MNDRDDDPRDRGLIPGGVAAPRPPLTEHQRSAHIAAALGVDDEHATRRRRALRHVCPRETCRASETTGCRARIRGTWRPITGIHAERHEVADLAALDT